MIHTNNNSNSIYLGNSLAYTLTVLFFLCFVGLLFYIKLPLFAVAFSSLYAFLLSKMKITKLVFFDNYILMESKGAFSKTKKKINITELEDVSFLKEHSRFLNMYFIKFKLSEETIMIGLNKGKVKPLSEILHNYKNTLPIYLIENSEKKLASKENFKYW